MRGNRPRSNDSHIERNAEMTTIGIFGSDDAAQAKAIAASLTKQAKGGFEGFHNNAKVALESLSHGASKVTIEGGCRAFHEYALGTFRGSCRDHASN
jgi:hypothetical protein